MGTAWKSSLPDVKVDDVGRSCRMLRPRRLFKHFQKPLWRPYGLSIPAREGVDCVASHHWAAGRRMSDLDFKLQAGSPGDFDSRSNAEQIVILCTAEKLEMSFDQRKKNPFCFQLGISELEFPPHQFSSTAFKPLQGSRIVKRPHLVRFAVADAQLNNM